MKSIIVGSDGMRPPKKTHLRQSLEGIVDSPAVRALRKSGRASFDGKRPATLGISFSQRKYPSQETMPNLRVGKIWASGETGERMREFTAISDARPFGAGEIPALC